MTLILALAALAQDAGPYGADPALPANRLHRAMFTWTPGGPRMPACVETDPLFWPIGLEMWKFADDLLPAIDARKSDRVAATLRELWPKD
jgi:hypothetical protein